MRFALGTVVAVRNESGFYRVEGSAEEYDGNVVLDLCPIDPRGRYRHIDSDRVYAIR